MVAQEVPDCSDQVTGAAFVGITTLDDENNFVSKLVTGNDELFRTVRITLVCDECEQRGLAEKCHHRLGMLPPWLDNEAFRWVVMAFS